MSASTDLAGNGPTPVSHPSPEPHHGIHSVLFYEEDSFLLDSLTTLLGKVLVAGDVAYVVATPAHREGLEQRLKARGLDLEAIAASGRYCALDAAETLAGFMVQGEPNELLFNSFMGYILSSIRPTAEGKQPHCVFWGETVALLCAEGNFDAALKLEQLWNDRARKLAPCSR